jgi:hypothetical protein
MVWVYLQPFFRIWLDPAAQDAAAGKSQGVDTIVANDGQF